MKYLLTIALILLTTQNIAYAMFDRLNTCPSMQGRSLKRINRKKEAKRAEQNQLESQCLDQKRLKKGLKAKKIKQAQVKKESAGQRKKQKKNNADFWSWPCNV